MDRCFYCRYLKGGHDANCPFPSPSLDFAPKPWTPKVEIWQRGYDDGRAGENERQSAQKDPTYVMGWIRGNAALEESENGYQMWGAAE